MAIYLHDWASGPIPVISVTPKAFLETACAQLAITRREGISPFPIKTGCRDHTAKEASQLAMTCLECVILLQVSMCLIKWGQVLPTRKDGIHPQHNLLYSLQIAQHFSRRVFLHSCTSLLLSILTPSGYIASFASCSVQLERVWEA